MSPLIIKTERVDSLDPRFSVTHRQELIAGFDQARLSTGHAVQIGAGGLGGEIGEGLCRKGIGTLRIFDHDVVDSTNLPRQFFYRGDVGGNKAICLVRNLADHCHAGTELRGYPLSFQDALALNIDLQSTVVVCGVDNNETRVAVADHYRRLARPVIFVAVDYEAEAGHVFVQDASSESACFVCAFPSALVPRSAPCFSPASKDILKVVAGLSLIAIDSVLMERKINWNYRLIHLADFAPSISLTVERNPKCPLCFGPKQGYPVWPHTGLFRGHPSLPREAN